MNSLDDSTTNDAIAIPRKRIAARVLPLLGVPMLGSVEDRARITTDTIHEMMRYVLQRLITTFLVYDTM